MLCKYIIDITVLSVFIVSCVDLPEGRLCFLQELRVQLLFPFPPVANLRSLPVNYQANEKC